MKRAGNLFDAIVDRENLLLAFSKASRGKADRPDRLAFAANLRDEIEALRAGLLDGTYPIGNYTQFTIRDPKERVITAAPFRERVLQHAIFNVCEPWFDKWMVFDTCASRKGKGQKAAVERARAFAGRYLWFLKCDFRKYFDSIPHEGIRGMLRRKFKDARPGTASPPTGTGTRLPTGTTTSASAFAPPAAPTRKELQSAPAGVPIPTGRPGRKKEQRPRW